MLTTDQHDQPRDEDRDDAILQRVTASEIPDLLAAFRAAVHGARIAADALYAHGIGPDRVTVEANLTDDGQPLVLITATTTGAKRTNVGSGGRGPRAPPRSADTELRSPASTQGWVGRSK